MAFEVRAWKKDGCSLSVKVAAVTHREPHSQEINEIYGEGGGLNANYRTVEAVAIVANVLGNSGLGYDREFVFKTGADTIAFDFLDEETRNEAIQELESWFGRDALVLT